MRLGSLDIHTLASGYQRDVWRPRDVVTAITQRTTARDGDSVWISRVPLDHMLARAAALERERAAGAALPLYGIPFAVKDNIDVAGVPTTAACPAFAYTPTESATVVQRLLDAGAIYVGKTNLDQFATGLVGTRSPYGACANAIDSRYVSGGSSSGSAVAVAAGLVSFALGTDTAGSGRVPAAFNNIVGLKPTRGLISALGVVPACRSLDCVSLFALTVDDAERVLTVAAGFDARDPYSRRAPLSPIALPASFRFGVPRPAQLRLSDDADACSLYQQSLAHLEALGGTRVEIDLEPFRAAASLLYEGPWVAERLSAVRRFMDTNADAMHPVVREILRKGEHYDAIDVFRAQQRLAELRRATETEWRKMDILAVPTAPALPTIDAVLAEPIQRNSELGYYTNFVNLLDLSALALPAGLRSDRLPFGITLIAPAFCEAQLCALGARYQQQLAVPLGATPYPVPPPAARAALAGMIRIAVVGAHLSGQPLNVQLLERDARLVRTCRTATNYRLYALRGTVPPKPGLVRGPSRESSGIEVEVWEMPLQHFGGFVAAIPAPLGIGTLTLEDGELVKGFLCEPYAVNDALDITHFGGWRAYVASLTPSASQPSATADRRPS